MQTVVSVINEAVCVHSKCGEQSAVIHPQWTPMTGSIRCVGSSKRRNVPNLAANLKQKLILCKLEAFDAEAAKKCTLGEVIFFPQQTWKKNKTLSNNISVTDSGGEHHNCSLQFPGAVTHHKFLSLKVEKQQGKKGLSLFWMEIWTAHMNITVSFLFSPTNL